MAHVQNKIDAQPLETQKDWGESVPEFWTVDAWEHNSEGGQECENQEHGHVGEIFEDAHERNIFLGQANKLPDQSDLGEG